jgi:hypothetical protein
MVSPDPAVDILQQLLSLLDRDTALQDLGVTSFAEIHFDDDKGHGMECEPSGLHFVSWEQFTKEVVEIGILKSIGESGSAAGSSLSPMTSRLEGAGGW